MSIPCSSRARVASANQSARSLANRAINGAREAACSREGARAAGHPSSRVGEADVLVPELLDVLPEAIVYEVDRLGERLAPGQRERRLGKGLPDLRSYARENTGGSSGVPTIASGHTGSPRHIFGQTMKPLTVGSLPDCRKSPSSTPMKSLPGLRQ
jgi:hypothetical protein